MIKVNINNEDGDGPVMVTVVTVGQPGVQDKRHLLVPGAGVQVEIGPAQFVMIDDKKE